MDGSRRGGLPLLQLGLGAGVAVLPQLSGGVPKGYLRVLVFNQDSALVDQRTLQLSKAALGNYEVLGDTLSIRRDGYVTVYVGNESAADVYFDELRLEHRQGLQVQENQYDPYGLDLAGVSEAAPGLRLKNFYQFNGKENQLDLGLNWNHQDWRFLDYQLGRWHEIDQLAEKWHTTSPYAFASNNPVLVADPDGRDNIIYMQVQQSAYKDFSKQELRNLRNEANANFKKLGLETRVHLAKGEVNHSKLDKTDAVAVIGRGDDVIGAVSKMNKGFAQELQSYKFGKAYSENPEISQNDQGTGGNIIAMDSRSIKEVSSKLGISKSAYGGFVVNHGAGHNSGLGDEGNTANYKGNSYEIPAISIMAVGNTQAAMMRGPTGTDALINTSANTGRRNNIDGLIQGYLRQRFGNHVATPHLPTVP